jgi:hypothetical protein
MTILIINPTTDAEFRECAISLERASSTPADLQSALRAYYPSAVVRPRGLSGEREAWYVYRDGHWVPSRPGSEDADDDRGST